MTYKKIIIDKKPDFTDEHNPKLDKHIIYDISSELFQYRILYVRLINYICVKNE